MFGRRHFGTVFFAWLSFLILMFLIGGNVAVTPQTVTTAPTWFTFIQMSPLIRFFEFLSGVGWALLYLRRQDFRLPAWVWTTLEVLSIAAVIVYILTNAHLSNLLMVAGFGSAAAHWYLHAGGFPVFGLAILVFAYRGGLMSRVLSFPLLVLLGEISFSTFMIHQLTLRFWTERGWLGNDWNPLALLVLLAVIYGGSYLSWRFIERPAQRAILKLGKGAFANQTQPAAGEVPAE
jgi:peptidoglycan/LPS O-acetylase OafA/YrhL